MDNPSPVDLSTAVAVRGLTTADRPGTLGLKAINLDLLPGTLTVIEGEPADGACEFVRCIIGEVRPTSGSLRVFGVDTTAMPDEQRRSWLAKHVGSVVRSSELLAYLTIGENLDLARGGEQTREMLGRLAAPELLDTMPADATSEQRWVVSLVRVLASDHDITVVVSPSGGTTDHRWMSKLRSLVDVSSSTVLVGMRKRDTRLRYDRLLTIRAGSVVGEEPADGLNTRSSTEPATDSGTHPDTEEAV